MAPAGPAYSYSISGNGADESALQEAIHSAVSEHGGEVASYKVTGGEVNVSDLEEAGFLAEGGADEELRGQALRDRAAELDISGRSGMTASELRKAIADAENE